MRKKIGLALGSGAVRGMVHVGVIKTLEKYNIPIDYIVGTSVGAWVGAHYATFKDVQKLEETTVGKTREKLFALFEPSIKGGIVKGEKMEKMLSTWLEDKEFKDTLIPFRTVATNLITSEKIIFSQGKLSTALRASMSVPNFFQPFLYENTTLVDGGISDPVPVDLVKDMGADIIIAVNLDNCIERKKKDVKINTFAKISLRSLEIMRHHLGEYSSRDADIIISPALTDEHSSWKEYFANNTGPKIMQVGIDATEQIIPELQKLLKKN